MKTTRILKAAALALTLLAGHAASAASVKFVNDSPPDPKKFAGYQWGLTFTGALRDGGFEVEAFARRALGGEAEILDQVSQGLVQVAMANVASPGKLEPLTYGVYLPYFFKDSAELDKALNEGGMLERINQGTTPKGVRVLGFYHLGLPAGVFNTKHPVRSLDDMKGLRLRALDKFQIALLKSWGATGTIIAWPEVTNALQTGVVDGYINPPLMPLLFGQTAFVKYYTDNRVAQSVRAIIASEDWYQSLSDDQRAVVTAAVAKANKENRAWLAKHEGILKVLEKAGVTVTRLTPEADAAFRKAAQSVYALGPLDAAGIAAWTAAKE